MVCWSRSLGMCFWLGREPPSYGCFWLGREPPSYGSYRAASRYPGSVTVAIHPMIAKRSY
eukprot:1259377-Rhodomonas_salina.1